KTFVFYGQCFLVVATAAADFANDVNVRQEIHFDAALPFTLAAFATSSGHVKGKATGLVSALARFGQHGIEVADMREDLSVGGRIRARRSSDGRLIDAYDFV